MASAQSANEGARLQELASFGLDGEERHPELEEIVQLVALLCNVPIATVTFVDDQRQWFEAKVGLEIDGTPLNASICALTIRGDDALVIPDTLEDARTAALPLVAGAPHLRAYAGIPLLTTGGHAVGALAAMDVVPRSFTPAALESLRLLANQVVRWLDLRRSVLNLRAAFLERAASHDMLARVRSELEAQVGSQAAALERALADHRRADSLYRTLFETTTDAVVLIDLGSVIHFASPSIERLLQYKPDELAGQPLALLQPPELRAGHAAGVAAYLRTGVRRVDWRATDVQALRKDGTHVPVEVSFSEIELDGERFFVGFFRDVSERQRLTEQLTHRATHDALTGLVNRNEFERLLHATLADASDPGAVHGLLYLDLDQFKVVNDTCGHIAGDELLKELAGVFQVQLPADAVVARLGGDEFIVLLRDCPPACALEMADGLRVAVSEFPFLWNGQAFHVGVSVGVVHFGPGTATMGQLLSQADEACYMAKDLGRNRVHAYTAGDAELAKRHSDMEWVALIRDALRENRFLLHCQPIVPMVDPHGQPHIEVLLRMRAADGELVPPMAFIPAAEHFNLMGEIDRWVIREVCGYLGRPGADRDALGLVAINLSGESVSDVALPSFIREQLDRHGIPGHRICFEITETAAIRNLAQALAMMHELRGLGCRFSLDDFGAGMSSLAYLKRLPVDFLKIDGSFVRDIATDPIDRAMVVAINQIGHLMGLKTVAEFVEDADQLRELREIGVDYGQGYGLAPPGPMPD